MAKGIEKSKGMIANAVQGVAGDMVINPRIGTAHVHSNSNTSLDMVSQIVSGIQGSVNGLKTQAAGNISIPVYLGGTLLDEVVISQGMK